MKDTITDESCSSFSLCIRVDKARRGEALEPESLFNKLEGFGQESGAVRHIV